jgi:O-antigen biosynthesis rhamnosyltransferase
VKILHFFKTYYPNSFGGTEQVIFQLSRCTARQGIEVEVLSLSRNPEEGPLFIDNHRVYQSKLDVELASTGFSVAVFSRFAELAREADVIHCHYPWPCMDLVHLLSRTKKPTVLTYHSDIIRQKYLLKVYRPLMHYFLNRVDQIVATSPNYLATSKILNQYREKTAVIPIGLDKNTYPIPSPDLIAHWRSKITGKFFLFVGMLRYYKGLHILLDAIKDTDLKVVILGSGPVEASLKECAKKQGINNVFFVGILPDEDKVALLQMCYAVVFPSHMRSEAFGISLLEGAMFGKPMISSEIGTGTSYVNIHGETGLVVPPSDPGAFRKAMQYLLENPTEAHKLGSQAEERYLNFFTADKMTAQYINIYEELFCSSAPRQESSSLQK